MLKILMLWLRANSNQPGIRAIVPSSSDAQAITRPFQLCSAPDRREPSVCPARRAAARACAQREDCDGTRDVAGFASRRRGQDRRARRSGKPRGDAAPRRRSTPVNACVPSFLPLAPHAEFSRSSAARHRQADHPARTCHEVDVARRHLLAAMHRSPRSRPSLLPTRSRASSRFLDGRSTDRRRPYPSFLGQA